MKCQEVEGIITDLARGVEVEGALNHLKECRRCGERLAEEERLTAGLLALADTAAGEQAPAFVEEKLLHSFRRQTALAEQERKWLPFAAAGLVAAGILLFKLFAPVNSEAPAATILERPPIAARVMQAIVEPAPVPPRKTRARRALRAAKPVRGPEPVQAETQFLPVVQGDAWTPLDGGRLVRVRLPRSALRVFGLPMDEARAQEQVQADVMLSNDGLLRAIRFVQ